MKTIVVNLMGAAGSGKSTLATELFARLKRRGYKCEYVDEYAKHLVYENNYERLGNQILVFSNQYFSMDVIRDKVDIIITDSPLVLSLYYNNVDKKVNHLRLPDDLLKEVVMHCYGTFDNLNYFIVRNHEYKKEGRYQSEEEARSQEKQLLDMLSNLDLEYEKLLSTDNCADIIMEALDKKIEYYKNLDKSGMEIERKFLVDYVPKDKGLPKHFLQAYFVENGRKVRIRNIDNKNYYRTEKFGTGIAREEFEKEISKEEFHDVMKNKNCKMIMKDRYYIPLANSRVGEMDLYYGNLEGLKTIEVEFSSREDAENFSPPAWFGKEITFDDKFKNENLAELNFAKNKNVLSEMLSGASYQDKKSIEK